MANMNFLDAAKQLQEEMNALHGRTSAIRSAVSEMLSGIKTAEKALLEKEEAAAAEQKEKDRQERMKSVLATAEDMIMKEPEGSVAPAVEAPAENKAEDPGAAPAPREEPKQEEPKAEIPEVRIVAEEPQAEPAKEEPKAEPVSVPVTEPRDNGSAPRQDVRSDRRTPGNDRPMNDRRAPGNDRPGNDRRNQGNDRPGNDRRNQGNDRPGFNRNDQGGRPQNPNQNRTPMGDRPRTDRPAQGGLQNNRPAQGGMQNNRPRPGGQGGFAAPAAPAASGKERTNFGPDKKAGQRSNYDSDKKAKNKKAIQKESGPDARNWEDDGVVNGRKAKRGKQAEPVRRPEPVVIEKAVITTETISVKDFSEKIGKPVAELIKKLFLLGIMATINQEIDFDTCELIASEYNIELEQKLSKSFEDVLSETAEEADSPEVLCERPPVVTIMGHVDHGKTSLLDAIRSSSITEGEAGGITQHIGAYVVSCNGRKITFIDTPGHEAFTSMRARGAQVTDVVILVVAADDGIMPQTVEAINHAKAANVPIVVAINKMDKPAADPDRVKQQLTEYGLVSEEWGGETICVPVSAKTKMGLDNLLEMVLLQADVLELKANPKRMAKGTIVEAKLDKGRGPIATVLVQNGTLKKGDAIVAGTAYGHVRAMVDDRGRMVSEAGPSVPVEVLGFNEVPDAGDVLNAVEADKLTRQVVEERLDRLKAAQVKSMQKVSLDDLFSQMKEGELKDLNLVIKADVMGSVEAVKQALEKLSNDEVRVRCIHGGVGAITGSDVMFASASNAIVIGFNVRPDSTAKTTAERENVDIRLYRIIYQAIEDIEAAMRGMFKPVFKEVEIGHANVRSTFKVSGVGTIAGAYVQDGKIQRSTQVRIIRDGIVIHEGKISSLKRFKDDVKEVATGYECGIGFENFNDIQEGDTLEAFILEQVQK